MCVDTHVKYFANVFSEVLFYGVLLFPLVPLTKLIHVRLKQREGW